jgi:monovalent cation/proton antiporter MnhG/PhaG subunit
MGEIAAGLGGVVGSALLLLGLTLATIGLYGLLRKPDIFHQLHPAGLITGPAVLLVLLASVGSRSPEIMTSAVLVIGFVLVTSSLSSHAIAQAALHHARNRTTMEVDTDSEE